jgi:hypothetical protein
MTEYHIDALRKAWSWATEILGEDPQVSMEVFWKIDALRRAWSWATEILGEEPQVSKEVFWKIYKSEMTMQEMTAVLVALHQTEEEG